MMSIRLLVVFVGLSLASKAALAQNQWRYEFVTLEYVDSHENGGVVAKGNTTVKHIVNGKVTEYPGQNYTLTLWNGNGPLGCLNLLTTAFTTGKKFMILTKDNVPFSATPTALGLKANTDLQSCGLRN